jgi:hypothetical protein
MKKINCRDALYASPDKNTALKRRMQCVSTGVLFTILFFTSLINASPYSGFYGGLGVASTWADISNNQTLVNNFPGSPVSFSPQTTSWLALLGVNFNPFIGVEFNYWGLGTVHYTVGDNTLAEPLNMSNVLLVGRYPLGEGFSVEAKGGLSLLKSHIEGMEDSDSNATLFGFGAGLHYALAFWDGAGVFMNYFHTGKYEDHNEFIPAMNQYAFGIDYQF